MPEPIVEINDLCVRFPVGGGRSLRALHHVSLSLHPGRIVALVGESGSGKSTVSKVITRLIRPQTGEVKLSGVDVLKAEPRRASLAYRRRVQMIFQDPFGSLNPAHTIAYHLERPLLRHGRATRKELDQRLPALLEEVGLQPAEAYLHKRPPELSGGQRQRVAIARALAVEPEVVLADEPTSMLDVSIRMEILNLLVDLASKRKVAMLLVTHDLASARYIADEIAVMYAGEIVEQGPADEIVAAPRHPYTQLLLGSVPDRARNRLVFESKGVERPDMTNPPEGCTFASRCPEVHDACRTSPAADFVSASHLVRCHAVALASEKEPIAS